jgi:hypothetical protein
LFDTSQPQVDLKLIAPGGLTVVLKRLVGRHGQGVLPV